MTEPVKGPRAYFPSIEKTYGRPIDEWLDLVRARTGEKHMETVTWLKAEHGIERVYSSCPSSKLAGYQLYGWRDIGHRDIEGSREHLLEALI